MGTDAEIHFLANTSNVRQRVKAAFRIRGMAAEWWDPLTGGVSAAGLETSPEGFATGQLDLDPYTSRVLVFSKRNPPPAAARSAAAAVPPLDLSSGWRVAFGPNGKPVQMGTLHS